MRNRERGLVRKLKKAEKKFEALPETATLARARVLKEAQSAMAALENLRKTINISK